MKTKKNKEIKLPMKFNPGTQKYEPILPLKKTDEKLKIKINLKEIIIATTLIILMVSLMIFLSNRYT
jgi:hypothetical protein